MRGAFLQAEAERKPFGDASGILQGLPAAVAVPHDAADVVTLVRWASATATSLIPRGAGTGMPGGNVGEGVAVDMVYGFGKMGELDLDQRRIRVGPGATLAALNSLCLPAGLRFPVDPSSAARCTVGGMIANNSGGSHTVRYGSTREWVHALEVVLADGSRSWLERGTEPTHPAVRRILEEIDRVLTPRRDLIATGWPRVRKNSSGYALKQYLQSGDAVDLLVGSEGTLALIVDAVLGLDPIPRETGLALLEFTSLEAAGEAVVALLAEEPATCEILDRTFLELVREGGADSAYPLRPGLEAILLVEVEGESPAEVASRLDAVRTAVAALASHASIATAPAEQHAFWEIRHAASPLIAARAGERLSMQFIEDGVVPVDRLPDYIRALRAVLARHELPAVIFGHAGDGNLHVNPLVDVRVEGWRETIEAVLLELAEVVAELGGTLSGEHGDGRLRAPLLQTVWGPELVSLFRSVKNAFDSQGILNPGVILPLPGQRPFDSLKLFPGE